MLRDGTRNDKILEISGCIFSFNQIWNVPNNW